jgi:hypothetical protein
MRLKRSEWALLVSPFLALALVLAANMAATRVRESRVAAQQAAQLAARANANARLAALRRDSKQYQMALRWLRSYQGQRNTSDAEREMLAEHVNRYLDLLDRDFKERLRPKRRRQPGLLVPSPNAAPPPTFAPGEIQFLTDSAQPRIQWN